MGGKRWLWSTDARWWKIKYGKANIRMGGGQAFCPGIGVKPRGYQLRKVWMAWHLGDGQTSHINEPRFTSSLLQTEIELLHHRVGEEIQSIFKLLDWNRALVSLSLHIHFPFTHPTINFQVYLPCPDPQVFCELSLLVYSVWTPYRIETCRH